MLLGKLSLEKENFKCKTFLDNGIHQWLQFPLTLETQRICEMPFDVIFGYGEIFQAKIEQKRRPQ